VEKKSRCSYAESQKPNPKVQLVGSFEIYGQKSVVQEKKSMVEEEELQLGKLRTLLGLDWHLDQAKNENPGVVKQAN
jgi:hypothetical protein